MFLTYWYKYFIWNKCWVYDWLKSNLNPISKAYRISKSLTITRHWRVIMNGFRTIWDWGPFWPWSNGPFQAYRILLIWYQLTYSQSNENKKIYVEKALVHNRNEYKHRKTWRYMYRQMWTFAVDDTKNNKSLPLLIS